LPEAGTNPAPKGDAEPAAGVLAGGGGFPDCGLPDCGANGDAAAAEPLPAPGANGEAGPAGAFADEGTPKEPAVGETEPYGEAALSGETDPYGEAAVRCGSTPWSSGCGTRAEPYGVPVGAAGRAPAASEPAPKVRTAGTTNGEPPFGVACGGGAYELGKPSVGGGADARPETR
jgi:hypothetical protein